MTNDQQDSIADQLSIAANPQILLRSASKKIRNNPINQWWRQSCLSVHLSALVSQSVNTPVPVSFPP